VDKKFVDVGGAAEREGVDVVRVHQSVEVKLTQSAQRRKHPRANRRLESTVDQAQRLQTADAAECVFLQSIDIRPREEDLRQVGVTKRIGGQNAEVARTDVEKSAAASVSRRSSFRLSSSLLLLEYLCNRAIHRPIIHVLRNWWTTRSKLDSTERKRLDRVDVDAIQHDPADVLESFEDEPVQLGHLRVPDDDPVDALGVGEHARMQRQRWNALEDELAHAACAVERVRVDSERQATVAQDDVEMSDPGEGVSLDAANVVPRQVDDARVWTLVDARL